MSAAIPAALFGDLEDPWAQSMAESLPAGSLFVPCSEDLPERWLDAARAARTVIRHRAYVSNTDLDRVVRARRNGWSARLVLCVGAAARYGLLERWAGLADEILSETTAIETLPRYLASEVARPVPAAAPGTPLGILSDLTELRSVLEDAARVGGYRPVSARLTTELEVSALPPLVVWDVPLLEPDWASRLQVLARNDRVVVALMGLADRGLVEAARGAGAAACLDLPCDPADLLYVLDRVGRMGEEGSLVVRGPRAYNPA